MWSLLLVVKAGVADGATKDTGAARLRFRSCSESTSSSEPCAESESASSSIIWRFRLAIVVVLE